MQRAEKHENWKTGLNTCEDSADKTDVVETNGQSDIEFVALDFTPIPTDQIENEYLREAMMTLDDDSEPSVVDLGAHETLYIQFCKHSET